MSRGYRIEFYVDSEEAAQGIIDIAKSFNELGFHIIATGRSYEMIKEAGIPCDKIFKIYEGRPNIADEIANGEIQMIINTPAGKTSVHDDSYIRKAAIKHRVPYITTMAAAKEAAKGIKYIKKYGKGDVTSLQELHSMITEE